MPVVANILQPLNDVEEWVLDCYEVSYSTATCDDCAKLAVTCQHLAHGGSYDTSSVYVASASYNDAPGDRNDTGLGFRCARAP